MPPRERLLWSASNAPSTVSTRVTSEWAGSDTHGDCMQTNVWSGFSVVRHRSGMWNAAASADQIRLAVDPVGSGRGRPEYRTLVVAECIGGSAMVRNIRRYGSRSGAGASAAGGQAADQPWSSSPWLRQSPVPAGDVAGGRAGTESAARRRCAPLHRRAWAQTSQGLGPRTGPAAAHRSAEVGAMAGSPQPVGSVHLRPHRVVGWPPPRRGARSDAGQSARRWPIGTGQAIMSGTSFTAMTNDDL